MSALAVLATMQGDARREEALFTESAQWIVNGEGADGRDRWRLLASPGPGPPGRLGPMDANIASLASLHPQLVHFAIALLLVGVLFRWLSLSGRLEFTDLAATTLIVLGTVAAVAAVQSGMDAHGPAEHIPGAGSAVHDHEEWGERARNIFLIITAVEVAALGLRRWKRRKLLLGLSAALGLPGAFAVYEAAEHGGEVVYEYAGGVATRSGELEDPSRLLLAGLYQKGMFEREQGHADQAARWFGQLAAEFPGDPAVQLLGAESLLEDSKDPAAALVLLATVPVDSEDRRTVFRAAMLRAQAHEAAGQREQARAVVAELDQRFPDNPRVQKRLAELD